MAVISKPAEVQYTEYAAYKRDSLPQIIQSATVPLNLRFTKGNTRTLTSNPNWRTEIAKQTDASRAYNRQEWVDLIPTRFRFTFDHSSGLPGAEHFRGSAWGTSAIDPSSYVGRTYDDALRDIALSRLKRKLANQTKHMNALVPIVEIRELRKLITYFASAVTDFLVTILRIMARPANAGNYRSLAKQVSAAWLTFSFAIKPTLSDIAAATEAIKNYLGEPPRSVVLRGSAKSVYHTSVSNYSTGALGWFSLKNVHELKHTLAYHYVAGCKINLLSANHYNGAALRDQFGIVPDNIGTTIWEIIPFSWLFDYFTTVGAFLDDTFTSPSTSTIYCTLARKYVCEIDTSSKVVSSYSNDIIRDEKIVGGYYTYVEFERTVLQKLPHRSLRFKTVDEIGKNAVNRLLNLLAVFVSGRKPIRG